MSVENGEWVLYGVDRDDPNCMHSPKEVIRLVNKLGFLPLFGNEIEGLSLEEHTVPDDWWNDDNEENDPWHWREVIARSGKVAYGKFFGKKAGFISKKWFPCFANMRRDGYDFDARWDDQMASRREKKIMDLFETLDTLLSHEVKSLAHFGKDGEKGFEGTMTNLQMQTYLCIRDFIRKKSKTGHEYGMAVALYCTPEHLWGRDHIASAYSETPEESAARIVSHILKLYPEVTPEQMKKVFGICI